MEHTAPPTTQPRNFRAETPALRNPDSFLDVVSRYCYHSMLDVLAARNGTDPGEYVRVLHSEAAAARSVAREAIGRTQSSLTAPSYYGTLAATYRAASAAAVALESEAAGIAAIFPD
jgi:hypothetical protein